MNKSSKATLLLLHSISSRLSTRDDCKNMQYVVHIKDNNVYMEQPIYIYPDAHHRRPSDKLTIIEYAQKQVKRHKLGGVPLVDGTYVYVKISANRNRRWTRRA